MKRHDFEARKATDGDAELGRHGETISAEGCRWHVARRPVSSLQVTPTQHTAVPESTACPGTPSWRDASELTRHVCRSPLEVVHISRIGDHSKARIGVDRRRSFEGWLVNASGRIYRFGDAGTFGDAGVRTLNKPIVGMAATSDGKGYWLVASDGGKLAYGDAAFHGSVVGQPLNQPIVGIASAMITGGYWLVAYDGGLFAFHAGSWCGSAGGQSYEGIVATALTPYDGSMQGTPLNAPMVGIAQM